MWLKPDNKTGVWVQCWKCTGKLSISLRDKYILIMKLNQKIDRLYIQGPLTNTIHKFISDNTQVLCYKNVTFKCATFWLDFYHIFKQSAYIWQDSTQIEHDGGKPTISSGLRMPNWTLFTLRSGALESDVMPAILV